MEITERLASFGEETSFESLPPAVVTAAKAALIDTIGSALAGSQEEGSQIVLNYARDIAASPEATVLATELRTSAAQAALVNGAFGHALDFDDVSISLRGHPSIPLVPAVLALAERVGSSGRPVLTAFLVGFEVECKVGRAVGPSSYARGWHATSVVGSIGAVAACAKLLSLGVKETQHAIGIAASMASGSRQNFGTMTKPLHAGLAARNGVEGALLAARGFTADIEIMEAPMGFGALFSPGGDWNPERLGELGEPWDIVTPGISVKKYPCCHMTHRALDATLAATEGRALAAADVGSVKVRVPEGSTSALIHHRPTTGLKGKFSMEYCVTAAVLDGGVRLASFEDEQVQRSQAQDVLRRVEVVHVPREDGGPFAPVKVTVEMRDGRSLSAEVLHERGSPQDPLTWEELVAKYRDCGSRVLPERQVERSLELLGNFEALPRVDELASCLSVGANE